MNIMKHREWTILKTQPYYALQIPNYHKYENECECANDDFDIKYNAKIFNDMNLETNRYQRQIQLKEIGSVGQEKIAKAKEVNPAKNETDKKESNAKIKEKVEHIKPFLMENQAKMKKQTTPQDKMKTKHNDVYDCVLFFRILMLP